MRRLTFKISKYSRLRINFIKLKNNKLYTFKIVDDYKSASFDFNYSIALRAIGKYLNIDLELFLKENCYKNKNGILYFEQKTLDKIIPYLESLIIINKLIGE